jgi:thiosulfate/3-mercaptopyruvate sulfurtransferase
LAAVRIKSVIGSLVVSAAPEILAWFQAHADQAEPTLILAARQGRLDILGQSAELTAVDRYGNNALWAACFSESSPCIKCLLDAGIDIDYQNPSGATVLIYAASSGKQRVVEQLLQAGANPNIATQDDFTALDLAANRECLRLMKQAVAQ